MVSDVSCKLCDMYSHSWSFPDDKFLLVSGSSWKGGDCQVLLIIVLGPQERDGHGHSDTLAVSP